MQSDKSKQLDLEVWLNLGGGMYHTQSRLRILYDKILEQKQKDKIAWLNRKSKFKDEDLT